MKNFKKISLTLLASLFVVGCDEVDPSVLSSLSNSSSSVSVTDDGLITAWPTDLKQLMNQTLGEELPFVALEAETLYYEIGEDDDNNEYLYIEDACETDLLSNYGATLIAAGFQKQTFLGYDFYLTDTVEVMFGWEEETDEYEAGNCIIAYPLGGTTQEQTDGSNLLTEWPSEAVELMNNYLGEEIPFVALDADSIAFELDTEEEFLYIEDCCDHSLVNGYDTVLTNAGYTLTTQDDYDLYVKGEITIYYAFAEATDDYLAGNYIYAYYGEGSSGEENWYDEYVDYYEMEFSTEWDEETIQTFLGVDTDIPSPTIDAENGFVWAISEEDEETVGSYCALVYGDVTTEYAELLDGEGFEVVEYLTSTYVIDWDNWEYEEVIYTDYIAFDPLHSYFIEFFSYGDLTNIYFVVFDDLFNDEISNDTEWNTQTTTLLNDEFGFVVPFVQLGEGYTTTDYLEESNCIAIEDTYYLDLLDGYDEVLLDAGYELVEDEDSQYYLMYHIEVNETNYYVDVYWNYGNVIAIYVDLPVIDMTTDTYVTSSASNKVVFEKDVYTVTVNQGSYSSGISSYCPHEEGSRVYWGSNMVFSWEEGSQPSTITINCTVKTISTFDSMVVTGGTMEAEDLTSMVITVDPEATEVTLSLENYTKGHIKVTSVEFC